MKLWAKWLVGDAEKGIAGHEKTDFRSTETGVTEGEEEKEPSPRSLLLGCICGKKQILSSPGSKIDLSKQACSDLDNSCEFQHEFL